MNTHSRLREPFNEAAALQLLPRIAPSNCAPSIASSVASEVKREASRQEWEQMKPRIEHLYIDQNKPFPYVTRVLRKEYGFEPTKRQFSRKAAEWGFKKNIPRSERRLLLLNLFRNQHGEPLDLKDRRIHPAKLDNWRKRYSSEASSLELEHSSSFQQLPIQDGGRIDAALRPEEKDFLDDKDETSSASIAASGRPSRHAPTQEKENSGVNEFSLDRISVFPQYSQELSHLLEALEAAVSCSTRLSFESCPYGETQTISLEDLTEISCERNKFLIYDLDQQPTLSKRENVETYKEDGEKAQLPWRDIRGIFFGWSQNPLKEVYVFPNTSFHETNTISISSKTLWDSLKLQELELTSKISTLERSLAPDHPAIISTLESLALIYYDQGSHIKAETLFRQVENLRADTLGPTNLKTLWTSRRIARVLEHQGKYEQAWEIINRIEPAILSLVGPEHDLAGELMNTKSMLLEDMGDYGGAEEIHRQVLQIRLQAFGPRDLRTRQSMNNLGVSLARREEYNGAEKLLRTVLQIHSESADTHNWRLYLGMSNLGWALRRQEFYGESYSVTYDAVHRSKASLGPEHPETLRIQTDFAWTLYEQGRLKESEEMYRAAWSLQCKLFGDSTVATLSTARGLARVLMKMNRFEEAIPWYEKVFGISLDAYGPEHRRTLRGCDNLGQCYENEGRHVDALELYQTMVEKLRACGSIEHPAVARFEAYIKDISEVMLLKDRC